MSNKIADKQRAKEAKMAESIHNFLKSDEMIRSFVFDEGDYDEEILALLKMQVLDDEGKIVDGVYTIITVEYLSNLKTNLNMRFAGIYNVKKDVLYMEYYRTVFKPLDIFTSNDFWVKWTSEISRKFDFELKRKAVERAADMFKAGKWKEDYKNKKKVEKIIMDRTVAEIVHGEMEQSHNAFRQYFGECYQPSDRLLALASVNEDYVDNYVDRLLDENTSFVIEELKEKIYQDLKDNFVLSFDSERNLNMFSKINSMLKRNEIKKSSMLDIIYVNNKGTEEILNNINPEIFQQYFETKRLSDLVNYNVRTLPADKADKLWKNEININDIQKLILNGQVIWTRYKADME